MPSNSADYNILVCTWGLMSSTGQGVDRNADSEELNCKVLLIGPPGCGKSSLLGAFNETGHWMLDLLVTDRYIIWKWKSKLES